MTSIQAIPVDTLAEIRRKVQEHADKGRTTFSLDSIRALLAAVDAASTSGNGEVVGEINKFGGITWAGVLLAVGTKLYASPQPSGIAPAVSDDMVPGDLWRNLGAEMKALLGAQEALATATEWFGQREQQQPATNSEVAIFARLSYVLDEIDATLERRATTAAAISAPIAPAGPGLDEDALVAEIMGIDVLRIVLNEGQQNRVRGAIQLILAATLAKAAPSVAPAGPVVRALEEHDLMLLHQMLAAFEASKVGQAATPELAAEMRQVNRLVGRLSSPAPSEAGESARKALPDDLTEDEFRSRAKAQLLKAGWKAGDQFSVHSVIENMVAISLQNARMETVTCGYPSCGCDHDAVCNAALANLPATPKGEGV